MFDPIRDLRGYIANLPTPFDAGGEIDVTAFVRLCGCLVESGSNALVVCTATGEAPTLTQSERITLVGCAVSAAAGRVPVIAGAISNDTARAIAFARDARQAGAAAILSNVPYYNRPTQSGIEAHFRAISEACGMPMILHDEPGRCARAIEDDTVARLVELPGIVGLCDSSGDLSRLPRLRALIARDIRLLSGHDISAPAFIAMGGDGCISGTCTIVPLLCRAFYSHTIGGDMAKARRLSLELTALTTALAVESEPAPLKHALALTGVMTDTLRLPLVPVSKPTRRMIAHALAVVQGWIGGDDKLCVNAG